MRFIAFLIFIFFSIIVFGNNGSKIENDISPKIDWEFIVKIGNMSKSELDSLKNVNDYQVWADSVVSHLNQLFEYNKENDLKGESHKNMYFLYYTPGKEMTFNACTPSYTSFQGYAGNHWDHPNFNGTPPQAWIDLNDSLCTYNNANNIRMYGVFYGSADMPGKTKITSQLPTQSAIVPFMQVTNAAENYELFSTAVQTIEQRIDDNSNIPQSADHKIVTIQSIFSENLPGGVNYTTPTPEVLIRATREVKTRTFYTENDVITTKVFSNFLQYAESIDTTGYGLYPVVGAEMYQRLKGFLDFFKYPGNLNGNFDCSTIPATHATAIAFRNCYCAQNPSVIEKSALYLLVRYIDNKYNGLLSSFNCSSSGVSHPEWLHNVFPKYKEFLVNNPSQQISIVKYILQNRISLPLNDVYWQDTEFWLSSAGIVDFQSLSSVQRIKFFNLRRNNWQGSPLVYRIEKAEYISNPELFAELIYHVPLNKTACKEFLDTLASFGGIGPLNPENLIYWIYTVINNNDGLVTIKAINKIATYAEGGPAAVRDRYYDFTDEGIVWSPNPWYWNFDGQFNYRSIPVNSPKVKLNGKVSLRGILTVPGFFNDETVVEFVEEYPFKLVPVSSGNISWRTDGGLFQGELKDACVDEGFLKCSKVVYYPLISIGWFVDHLNNDQVINGVIAAAEVASMFIGVGEFAALMRIKDATKALKLRRAVAGFTAVTEGSALVLPNGVSIYYENQGLPAEQVLEIKNKVAEVSTYLAVAGGAAQLGDMLIGVGKYLSIKSLISSNVDNLDNVANDVKRYLSTYPPGSTIAPITPILEAMQVTGDVSTFIKGLSPNRQLMLISEILDIGHPLLKSDIKYAQLIDKILEADELKFAFYGIPEFSGITKLRAKLLTDISNGNMIDDFITNPELIKGWKILNNGGSSHSIKVFEEIRGATRLEKHNLYTNLGTATKIDASHVNRYTNNGNYINYPMRGPLNEPLLNTPDIQLSPAVYESYSHIMTAFTKWRTTSRHYTIDVWRGRAFTDVEFNTLFGSNSPLNIPLKGFQSCSKEFSVAENFASQGAGQYKVIFKIKPKAGIDIDDISDFGPTLKPIYNNNPGDILQYEVLLKEGLYRKIGSPTPIPGMPSNWFQVELEELDIAIRTITSQ